MGEVFDKVCCIEETSYSRMKTRGSTFNAPVKHNNKRISGGNTTTTENYDVSELNRIPSSEIKFANDNDNTSKQFVTSLSRLPIGVSNVIRKNTGIPSDHYVSIKNIGKGAYGKVVKVMHKQTGAIRSMKVIPKDNLRVGFTEEEIQMEINILKSLDHPNIIKIYEFYNDDNFYYLINEFCSEGDLSEKLIAAKYFDECIVKVLMFQIFSAVLYLHSKNVIHGDLKLENLMIDSIFPYNTKRNNVNRRLSFISSMKEDVESIKRSSSEIDNSFIGQNEDNTNTNSTNNNNNGSSSPMKMKFNQMKNFNLKLIDFGCSKIFTPYKRQFEDTIGTLVYCSPEVLKNHYDEKCDVWSCGVIMYILLSGELPFYGQTESQITSNILNNKYTFDSPIFNHISPNAKDLIRKCFIYNKNKRINIKDALKHPFFNDDIDPHNIFQETIDSSEVLNSLTKFSKQSKFYQAVLAFLSHNYADKTHIDKLKKIFLSIDLNFDGKISKEELSYAYHVNKIALTKEQIENIIKAIDFDNNGYIEYEEFIRAAIPKEHLFTEANLKTAFDLFDLDGNGRISPYEVKEILGMDLYMDDNVVNELLKEIIKSGNEEITFEQFKEIMKSFQTK